jgi:hypothetical protein
VGPARKNHPKYNAPTSKIQNCFFPGSQNRQKFTGERLNYQEHNERTNTQKSIQDCSQKFEQYHSFPIFQEFYGSG